MTEENEDRINALDTAIAGFGDRAIAHARRASEKEIAALEPRILALEAATSKVTAGRAPNSSTPPPSSSSLPPLPRALTVSALENYVRALGFDVANNRPTDGGLWVFHDAAAFGNVAKYLEKAGVGISYLPEGRKRRAGPQYHLDPLKRLPP
jgi:hypothetical protein